MTQCRPVRSEVSTSCQHSSTVTAAGDLRGGVLAGLHGGDADGDVPFPRGGREDQVEVFLLAKTLEVGIAARIARRLGVAGLGDPALNSGHFLRDDVADGGDLDARDFQEVADVGRAHAPHADHAQADVIDG